MKSTLRTFVAVEISQQVRARAVELIAALGGAAAGVKWVEPENLHLTLKFLGEVHQREIVRVCQAVERGVAKVAPFELEVRGAGAFPTAARPHTVWLGAGDGTQEMVALHDRVEDALAELGHRKEHRRFQVHLTLGRVRGPVGPACRAVGPACRAGHDSGGEALPGVPPGRRDLPAGGSCLSLLLRQQADFLAGRMRVEKVTVFSSTLTPAGAIYDVLGTARLGG